MSEERIVVYEKPTCTTCRRLSRMLRERGIEFDAIDYTIDPISREKLVELTRKMGISPRELLRKREEIYKTLDLGRPDATDDEILDAMAEHPTLVQRPIVERGDRAVLARPPEKVEEIL